MNQFLRLLLGMGLVMTEPRQRRRIYDRVTDQLDDVADQASQGYEAVANGVERLYRTARGEDHRGLSGTATFLIGMGVGAGVGLLMAPASGKKTRETIVGKIRDIQADTRRTA
jgi:hypothetical protein